MKMTLKKERTMGKTKDRKPILKTDYNKSAAKGWFIALKLIEVIGLFILIIGFYGLGLLSNVLVEKGFDPFGSGLLLFLLFVSMFILTIMVIIMIIFLSYNLIRGYLKLNWRWAKSLSRTKNK